VPRREQAVYGGPWPELRLRVLARDGYRCQVGGPRCQGEATIVDHIWPWREGGPWWDMGNLRASCRSCNTARAYRGFESRRRPSREW
jgi:5-methylcytosine-specific restriction endonuclease McrA